MLWVFLCRRVGAGVLFSFPSPPSLCFLHGADPTYSSDFFDGKHYVLKGASWATDTSLVRTSFRNFYQARYPYVFSKFRVVYDRPTAAWGG